MRWPWVRRYRYEAQCRQAERLQQSLLLEQQQCIEHKRDYLDTVEVAAKAQERAEKAENALRELRRLCQALSGDSVRLKGCAAALNTAAEASGAVEQAVLRDPLAEPKATRGSIKGPGVHLAESVKAEE